MESRHFFWMFSQVERIEADEDLRMLRVLTAVNSNEEGYAAIRDGLNGLRGNTETFRAGSSAPIKEIDPNDDQLDPEFDRAALRALKARHSA